MRLVFQLVSAAAIAMNLSFGAGAQERPLWRIGARDRDTADLALGADGWREYGEAFPHDALFVIGRSTARRDWPYVQPGPADAWAGSRSHTFTIIFALDRTIAAPAHLIVDLADTHDRIPPLLAITLNEDTGIAPGSAQATGLSYKIETPPGGPDAALFGDPSAGESHRIVIALPAGVLRRGTNEIRITSLEGSWILYDALALEAAGGAALADVAPQTRLISVKTRPLLREIDGKLMQPIEAAVLRIGDPAAACLQVGETTAAELSLTDGYRTLAGLAPAVREEEVDQVELIVGGKTVGRRSLRRTAVPRWTVGLIHHTHLDIGYTDVQSEVERRQWAILEQAVGLSEDTKTYPKGSRFKFSPEGLWAVDSYLRQAPEEKRQRFLEAVRRGRIDLGALYGNELTGLCRPEELFELPGCARRLARDHGLVINSAMISDVPGYSWGLVPALASSGVRYLSLGPNPGHRIGATLREWGDRPFYWVSPSGHRKILVWMAGRGYAWGHALGDGIGSFAPDHPETNAFAREILDQIAALRERGYPYDIVQMRYSIGGDNGPPDPALADFVKCWNERFTFPRLEITTTSELFSRFENRFGSTLPELQGDFTPYWEDGAASSARETALNRAAAERLVQARTLWAMLAPGADLHSDFDEAWRNVILYDEHTWGAWNSISAPQDDFVLRQWQIKQGFALEADSRSRALLDESLGHLPEAPETVSTLLVFNTDSWPRTDLVVIEADRHLAGERILGPGGLAVPSQRLSTGKLVFLAVNVPPLGSARYTSIPGPPEVWSHARAQGNRLSNAHLTARLDEQTGAVAHLRAEGVPGNLVAREPPAPLGLGDLLYVAGRDPGQPLRAAQATIRVGEPGPLVASLITEGPAPGCRSLQREVRLVAGLDHLEIALVIDKEEIHRPEAVHIAFPFAVRYPATRLGLAWAVIRPQIDQLPGSCKNYYTIQRWVDVSNEAPGAPPFGLTWASPDAPLLELGSITTDPTAVGWMEKAGDSSTLYSYAMNNYWETNYKAGQEGPVRLRYAVRPHAAFDAAAAQRFGIERGRPLLAAPVPEGTRAPPSLLGVEPADVLVTSLSPGRGGEGLMLRLFNAAERSVETRLSWNRTGRDPDIWRSTPEGDPLEKISEPFALAPFEVITLRAALP